MTEKRPDIGWSHRDGQKTLALTPSLASALTLAQRSYLSYHSRFVFFQQVDGLTEANLTEANLTEAKLIETNLTAVSFTKANRGPDRW